MMMILFLLVAAAVVVEGAARPRIATAGLRAALRQLDALAPVLNDASGGLDLSLECALCGVALNEINGLVAENRTQETIEREVRERVCKYFAHEPVLAAACDALAGLVPTLVAQWDKRYNVQHMCVDVLHLCKRPIPTHADPRSVSTLVVNLDEPADTRWAAVCSTPEARATAAYLYSLVTTLLPGKGKDAEEVGEALNDHYFPAEYAAEIRGCAQHIGMPYGWLSLLNPGYEVSDACTSITATGAGDTVVHGRNLDFFLGMALTDALKNATSVVRFERGGVEQYRTVQFAGMVGVLSGMRPNAFTLTINTRFYPGGIGELFWEVVVAIEESADGNLVAFLARDALATTTTYADATHVLATRELVADCYYTVSGVRRGEGMVISRNRTGAANIRRLAPPDTHFLVQTNYDSWKPGADPWFDDRRHPAMQHMRDWVGGDHRANATNMYRVMSAKPTLNLQSTYTLVSIPAQSYLDVHVRYCPYPCVQ